MTWIIKAFFGAILIIASISRADSTQAIVFATGTVILQAMAIDEILEERKK